LLRDRLERGIQAHIEGAWPLLTAALQVKQERLRANLTVVHDAQHGCAYIGGYQQSGERLSAKLKNLDAARLWTELFEVLRSAGVNIGEERRVGARVRFYSTGAIDQIQQSCPFWKDFIQRNDVQVEAFDELAQVVQGLPTRHPSNLLKALPGELQIDGILKGLTAAAVAAGLLFGVIFGNSIHKLNTKGETLVKEQVRLNDVSHHLSANKQEISNLKLLYGSDVGWSSPGRAEFLRALAGAIPSTASATELSVDESGGFRLSGLYWQANDKDSIKTLVKPIEQLLVSNLPSIVIASDRSFFEAKTGRFTICGLLNKE
jgi:hypothetical protein